MEMTRAEEMEQSPRTTRILYLKVGVALLANMHEYVIPGAATCVSRDYFHGAFTQNATIYTTMMLVVVDSVIQLCPIYFKISAQFVITHHEPASPPLSR